MSHNPPSSLRLILDRRHDTAAARIAAWGKVMSASGRVEVAEADADGFEGRFLARTLGEVRVMQVASTRFRFERSPKMAANMVRDHLLVNVVEAGRIEGRIAERAIKAEAGALVLSRMATPMDVVLDGVSWLALIIPKDILDRHMIWRRSLDGRVFAPGSAPALLLAAHMRALLALSDPVPPAETELVARSSLALLSTSLGAAPRTGPTSSVDGPDVAQLVRRFIFEHLRDPELDVAMICARFSLSRSSLYRLMGERSDIAGLIRDLRLRGAKRDILSGHFADRTIEEIGRRWGLPDERSFRRAFVRAFGQSPSHLRRSVRAGVPLALQSSLGVEDELERWFTGL